MSDPAFVALEDGATLTVSTPLGIVSLVCQDGEVRLFVPPSVKVEMSGEARTA